MIVISEWINKDFFGNPILNYLLFLFVLFGVYAGYFILIKLLKSKISQKLTGEEKKFSETIINFIRNPLKIILVTFAVWIGVKIFKLPAAIKDIIHNIYLALLAITISYLLLKIADAAVEFLESRVVKTKSKLDDHLLPIFNTVIKVFIIIVTILLVIHNMGYNITSLLAGLGLGGVAVALAAQDTLANFFGAIAIFIDQPFQVGDAVKVEGFAGSIEAIGIRSTRLRTFDGTLVVLPNSLIAKTKIDNLSAMPTRRTNFTIGLTYNTGYEKLQKGVKILREILSSHISTVDSRAYFNSYGDFSLKIIAQHWCKYLDYDEYLKAIEEINFEILKEFEKEGIEFAFPTQTVFVK